MGPAQVFPAVAALEELVSVWATAAMADKAVFVSAFFGRPGRTPLPRNTWRRWVMADWVKWVHEELSAQGLPSPADEEIREEIRKALYAARRDGVRYAVLNPKQNRIEADGFIKKLRKRIIAPARAKRWNEVLDKYYVAFPWRNQGGSDDEEEQGKVEEPAQAGSAPAGKK